MALTFRIEHIQDAIREYLEVVQEQLEGAETREIEVVSRRLAPLTSGR